MTDRALTVSFGISLGIHLVLLIAQALSIPWFAPVKPRKPSELIYEYKAAQQELRHLQVELARAKRETAAAPAASNPGQHAQIRIPDRPSLTDERTLGGEGAGLGGILPERSSVIDLTNLVEASRGDAVLMSYFGAIREQIQQTANRRAWLTGEITEGVVYVSFVLDSTGDVERAAIVPSRSVPFNLLHDIALRIVKTAAPFPPFPPSMTEPSKTIVVPLEFLLGS